MELSIQHSQYRQKQLWVITSCRLRERLTTVSHAPQLLVKTVVNKATQKLTPLSTIYYDLNVSDLSATNRAKLDAVATTQIANNYKVIWIYGYTDIQTGVNNQVLSKFRATKVIAYLHKLLPKLVIKYKFFGPANPVNKAHTQAAYAQNRRSEILGREIKVLEERQHALKMHAGMDNLPSSRFRQR